MDPFPAAAEPNGILDLGGLAATLLPGRRAGAILRRNVRRASTGEEGEPILLPEEADRVTLGRGWTKRRRCVRNCRRRRAFACRRGDRGIGGSRAPATDRLGPSAADPATGPRDLTTRKRTGH